MARDFWKGLAVDYVHLLPLLQWPVKTGFLVFKEEVACFIASAGMFIAHVERSLCLPIPFVVSLMYCSSASSVYIAYLWKSSGIPIRLHTTSCHAFIPVCSSFLVHVHALPVLLSGERGCAHLISSYCHSPC